MIELIDVSFQYGEEEAECTKNGTLRDINLTIPDGQVVLLCGESGCGKTTITRLLNGLIPNFYEGTLRGSIKIDGKEIKEQPLYETAFSVGTVFQNPRSQFYNVDTTSELAFGLENRGVKVEQIQKKVNEIMEDFHIKHLSNRSIFKLSGGEKQKIACACVSVCSPQIIILDEPSANLDLHSIEQMSSMILKWKSQGKTIVIAEHRISYVWDLIDRAIYMKDGKIEEDMDLENVRKLTEEQLHKRGLRSNSQRSHTCDWDYVINKSVRDLEPFARQIVFKNFYFAYEKNKTIFDISKLGIPEKQITAVVGNNGIGKTTFLRCICGLESKCTGVMEWNEKVYPRKKRINEIFLVMQDVNHQLFTESVLDEVLISMDQVDEKKALEILSTLDLLEYKDRHPVSLSGGQKQRVAVATAIASKRQILLFDEPTSGLDYRHMLQVAQLLIDLKRQGKTIIVVTHDLEFIENLGANVIRLKEN